VCAMMVAGAMPLREVVAAVNLQGGTMRLGPTVNGERVMFLERNRLRVTIFTDDLDVVVGPDTVEMVENGLHVVIDGLMS